MSRSSLSSSFLWLLGAGLLSAAVGVSCSASHGTGFTSGNQGGAGGGGCRPNSGTPLPRSSL